MRPLKRNFFAFVFSKRVFSVVVRYPKVFLGFNNLTGAEKSS